MKYLWDKEEIDVVLSGMSTNNDLDENLKIADEGFSNSLTPEEKDIIQEVRTVYRFRKQVDCTQCGYCMPCPSGGGYSWKFSAVEPFIYVSGH